MHAKKSSPVCMCVQTYVYRYSRPGMEIHSALLALCGGIHRWPADSCHNGPMMGSFHVSFAISLKKLLNKESSCWWYETPSSSCYVTDNHVFLWSPHAWWRHEIETFPALLAICAGSSPVPGEFPAQKPVTRSSDIFFDLRLNNRLSKQSWGWWFETPSRPLWRHRNVCRCAHTCLCTISQRSKPVHFAIVIFGGFHSLWYIDNSRN